MHATPYIVKRRARVSQLLLAVLVVLLGGCASNRGNNGEGATVIGWKTVMQKVSPAYLIAVDRSQCTVSTDRFSKAKEGESFLCAWSRSAVATDPQGSPYPGEAVGIPGSPDRPRIPPPTRTPPWN